MEVTRYSCYISRVYSSKYMCYQITYGIHVKPENDPYVHIAEEALKAIGEAGVPGRFIVDMIPLSK